MARRAARESSGHSILVVDDQEETLLSLRVLLERDGHQVFTATSGADALSVLQQADVHLLLIDYFMPGMNGDVATALTPAGTDGGVPSATGPTRVDPNAASSKTTS